MKHWIPDSRIPNDIDIIGIGCGDGIFEFHWCDAMRYILTNNVHDQYVDLDFLYTIKVSHCAWIGKNGKWVSHLKDVHRMKLKGAKIDQHLYDLLYEEWSDRFGEKKVKLTVDKFEFFNENVKREYDHDYLHKQLAIKSEPSYKLILKDDSEILCCGDKFDKLPEHMKELVAREELAVITFERYSELPYKIAKAKAFEKLVTSMTKGWFNLYLIENAVKIMRYIEHDLIFINKWEKLTND